MVGALAYTLSPRVLTTVGGLSSEALPVLLAPAILLPVVLATPGPDRAAPGRCALGPGRPVLRWRQRNGHAARCRADRSVAADPPALVAGAGHVVVGRLAVVASAWWLGPLVVLGRWSPPFLDWIERG